MPKAKAGFVAPRTPKMTAIKSPSVRRPKESTVKAAKTGKMPY